jgi:hypothetical protein
MEGLLEALIRTRRYELWNKIQIYYSISDTDRIQIERWIASDCSTKKPKCLTKGLGARAVPHADTSISPHHL